MLGALAAGGADAWDRLSPSLEELQAKQYDPRYTTMATTPSSFAASAAMTTGVSNRMLK
jgi:hypothetical protein